MKRTVSLYVVGMIMLFGLPGCGRIIDWGKSNFYQGEQIDMSLNEVAPFMRSITIYDQLETRAMFDVLWLSDEVRTAYAKLHILRQGKDDDRQMAFLRRQLEENLHYISFYVLSLHETKLGDKESHWSLFLQIDGVDYLPIEIKEIDLPYEYQVFFGKKWNRFKVPYLVRFRAKGTDDAPLVTEQTKRIVMYVRSAHKEHAFIWQIQQDEQDEPAVYKPIKKKKKKRVVKEFVPRKRIRK